MLTFWQEQFCGIVVCRIYSHINLLLQLCTYLLEYCKEEFMTVNIGGKVYTFLLLDQF